MYSMMNLMKNLREMFYIMSTWNIDVSHTNLGFTIRHMMVSKVRGNFTDFEGKIEGDPEDLATSKVSFKVDMNSINTNSEDRDNHLRSPDFFETEKYPAMTFNSTKVVKTSEDDFDLIDDLKIKVVKIGINIKNEYVDKTINTWDKLDD